MSADLKYEDNTPHPLERRSSGSWYVGESFDQSESALVLQGLVDNARNGIIILRDDHSVYIANNLWFELWDFIPSKQVTAEELMRKLALQLRWPDQFERFLTKIDENPRVITTEVFALSSGKFLECESNPIFLANREIGHILALNDATTDIMGFAAQDFLGVREDALKVPYKLCFETSQYEFIGCGIKTLLGVEGKVTPELIGKLVQKYRVIGIAGQVNMNEYSQAFKSGKLRHYRVEMLIQLRDGTKRWIRDSSVSLKDGSGTPIGAFGILEEIKSAKAFEPIPATIQLDGLKLQSVKKENQFLSFAHEINNPNNFISLNAPIVAKSWESIRPILDSHYAENGDFSVSGLPYSEMADLVPEAIHAIMHGSERIQMIVQELRDSHLSHENETMMEVSLNDVVKNAIVLCRRKIRDATDFFDLLLHQELPTVFGSARKLEQVVVNLLLNSCQSLQSRDSAIQVATDFDSKEGMIILQVYDEGTGIPKENLERVSESFFTTKSDRGGSGLGLSISTEIVHNHGGTIDLQSAPDVGTQVTVKIPMARRFQQGGRQ